MNTGSYLFAASIFSIAAAFGYTLASHPDVSNQWQVFWFVIAVASTSLTVISIFVIVSQNTHIIDALADAVVKMFDKKYRMASVVATMTIPQLTFLENAESYETIREYTTGENIIRVGGIELNEAWLNGYLTKLEPSAPDFLPIRYDRDAKEIAAINVFVMEGWAKKRVSRVAVWINGHSPQTAREALELGV